MKDTLATSIILVVSLFAGIYAFGQNVNMRLTPASCGGFNDGAVEIVSFEEYDATLFKWYDQNKKLIKSTSEPKLSFLAGGHYSVRITQQRMLEYLDLVDSQNSFLKDRFAEHKIITINTLGKSKVRFSFVAEAKDVDINKHIKLMYSLDGITWMEGYNFYREKSIFGLKYPMEFEYATILPFQVNNKSKVWVALCTTDKKARRVLKKNSDIHQLFISSLTNVTKNFVIEQKSDFLIKSFVSNELTGKDGYIELTIEGGAKPYTYYWSTGERTANIQKLSFGYYRVEIEDANGCKIEKSFEVKTEEIAAIAGSNFSIEKGNNANNYSLLIQNIYDRFINLNIVDQNNEKIKKFFIHPLNKNIKVNLDLAGIPSGIYKVVLTADDISQISNLVIP